MMKRKRWILGKICPYEKVGYVFDKMEFHSEIPSGFTVEGHEDLLPTQMEIMSQASTQKKQENPTKSHRGDNMLTTPKVGVEDPTQKTHISLFHGKEKGDPTAEILEKMMESPHVQSHGAASKVQEKEVVAKKTYGTLAISHHQQLSDEEESPKQVEQSGDCEDRDGDRASHNEERAEPILEIQ